MVYVLGYFMNNNFNPHGEICKLKTKAEEWMCWGDPVVWDTDRQQ
jgi:hypothetical protein